MINFIFILLIYFLNLFFIKKNYLVNYTGQPHQLLSEKKIVPLTGGFFLLLFFFLNLISQLDLLIFLFLLFLIGVMTDLNIIKSPSKRIFIQFFLLISFVFYFEMTISDLRIDILNFVLSNNIYNSFFVAICFLVLINGSNFIDGNNGITIGYYLIIFFIILIISDNDSIIVNKEMTLNFLIFLSILLIFNLSNFLYLGDSGVYLISVFSGYFLINLTNQNMNISPYFISNLLWYPSFELLFSMIRKFRGNLSPMKPDTNHLHQLIFKYFKNNLKLSQNFTNSFTGIIINLYNIVILLICSVNYSSTIFQVTFLLFNILVYLMIYNILRLKF